MDKKEEKEKNQKIYEKLKKFNPLEEIPAYVLPAGMRASHCIMPSWFSTRGLGGLEKLLDYLDIQKDEREVYTEAFHELWEAINDSSDQSLHTLKEKYKNKHQCNPAILDGIIDFASKLKEERKRIFSPGGWG